MIKGARFVFIILLSIFILNFISAAAIEDNLHLNIQALNSSGDIVTGTFVFTFNISTTSDCANVVYAKSASLTTDSRGIISYYLTNTNLNYSDQYWLCYYRDNVLIDASKLARNPYTFYANNSENWQGMNNFNATQMENSNNLLNIKESWLSSLLHSVIDPIFTALSNNVSSVNTTLNIQNLYNSTLYQGLGIINTTANIQHLINGTNMNFGNVDFNGGGFLGGNGVSIVNGDIWAKTIFVYNISSISINNLNVNGSLYPAFDSQFDLGNSSFRWRNIYSSGNIYSNGTIFINNGTDIQSYISNNAVWNQSGSNIFLNTPKGNVSIGATTSLLPLSIRGVNNPPATSGTVPNGVFSFDGAIAGNTLYMGAISDSPYGLWLQTSNRVDLSLTYPLLLNPRGGNVGIGTTNPLGKLHILNGAGGGSTPTSQFDVLSVENNDTSYINIISPTTKRGGIIFSDDVRARAIIGYSNGDSSLSQIDSLFFTANGTVSDMVINGAGNVGIGTTNPAAGLEVYDKTVRITTPTGAIQGLIIGNLTAIAAQTAGTKGFELSYNPITNELNFSNIYWGQSYEPIIFRASNFSFKTGTSSTSDALFIDSSQRVGIGTSNPTTKLYLNGADTSSVALTINNSDTGGTAWKLQSTGSIAGSGAGNLQFLNGSDISMIITKVGNVGIGATAPAYNLEIAKSTKALNVSGFLYVNSSNVGIGTTSPQVLLQLQTTAGNGASNYPIIRYNNSISAFDAGVAATGDSASGDFYIADNAVNVKRLVIQNGTGNVGIGTTSPAGLLHEQKAVASGSDFYGADLILSRFWGNDTNTRASGIYHYYDGAYGSDKLVFGVTGGGGLLTSPTLLSNAKMVIQANGNVGIGNTAPSSPLTINASTIASNGGIRLFHYTNSSALSYWSETQFAMQNNSGSFAVVIDTNGNSYFNGGNVGIGTNNPISKLHISTGVDADVGKINITLGSPSVSARQFVISKDTTTPYAANIYWGNHPSAVAGDLTLWSSQINPIMTLKGTGNVGIGTTNPLTTLNLNGTAVTPLILQRNTAQNVNIGINNTNGGLYLGITPSLDFAVGPTPDLSSTSPIPPWLTINSTSGNVGIGTTNPTEKLQVEGGNFQQLIVNGTNAARAGSIKIYNDVGNYTVMGTFGSQFGIASARNQSYISTQSAGQDLLFGNSNFVERMRINMSSGNVGIGTNIPTSKLYVFGDNTAGVPALTVWKNVIGGTETIMEVKDGTNGGTTRFMVRGDGNVGIGTTNPLNLLTISGGVSALTFNTTLGRFDLYNHGDYFQITNGSQAFMTITNPAGNVGIGTTTPKTELSVNGSSMSTLSSNGNVVNLEHYTNLASYGTNVPATVGTMKITLPQNWTSTMMTIKITGYAYNSNLGAWELTISGYDYAPTPIWTNYKATLSGRAPFNSVRLGNNGSNGVILLGTTATTWSYPQIQVTDFYTGYTNAAAYNWGSGWSITNITSEAGIGQIVTPVIDIYTSSTGKIGINGTLSPAYNLEIGESAVALNVSGMLYVNSSNVGINTFNPLTPLDVAGDVNLNNQALTAAGTLNRGYYVYRSGVISYGLKLQYTGTEYGTMMFGPNQSSRFLGFGKVGPLAMTDDSMIEYMRVDLDTGNLGIGTASPIGKLDVVTGGTHANAVTLSSIGTVQLQLRDNDAADNQRFSLQSLNGNFFIGSNNISDASDYLGIMSMNGSTGNVGIGTKTPLYTLDVNSSGNVLRTFQTLGTGNSFTMGTNFGSGNNISLNPFITGVSNGGFEIRNTTTNLFTIGPTGNIGIETTNPQALLNVNGAALFGNTNASQPGALSITTEGASPIRNRLIYGTDGTGWKFAISKNQSGVSAGITDQLVIQDNGNVGIGTTVPASKLDVVGGIIVNGTGSFITNTSQIYSDAANGLTITGRTGSTYDFAIAQSDGSIDIANPIGTNDVVFPLGNVGIGTTTPTDALNVVGNANFTGNISSANFEADLRNVSIGWNTGNNLGGGNTGDYVVTIGNSAGFGNTGGEVVAIGLSAGSGNTGSYVNTIGVQTGFGNKGHFANLMGDHAGYGNLKNNLNALGGYAGYGNNGTDVTAIGTQAGYGNNGSYVSAIGFKAASLNTGENVTAMGYQAGYGNTGDYVNAIGYRATEINIGNKVNAMGYQAGYNNKGNIVNAIGYTAGWGNTGNYTDFMGFQAGYSNTGNFLLGIGQSAAYFNGGNFSIFIGNSAGVSNFGNNVVTIGNSAGQVNNGSYANMIGYLAGNWNNGSYVNLMGEEAGVHNNGSYVEAIGYRTGWYNEGNYSIFIGSQAGLSNKGDYVTAIGSQAGTNNKGNNSIFLGYQAGMNNAVDNQFKVMQVNVNGIPLIRGNFSSGIVNMYAINVVLSSVLPTCTTGQYNGTMMRNNSGTYGCNGVCWGAGGTCGNKIF